MKTLHLIRHAKSSWEQPHLADVERPLNKRGYQACKTMAGPIVKAGCDFQHVFCSIATRAQLTLQGIADALPDQHIQWQLEEALYTFSSQCLLDWICELDNELKDIVIIGHNPAMTQFCNAMGDIQIENMPTCGYAQLAFAKNSWKDLSPGSGKQVSFLKPKMFK